MQDLFYYNILSMDDMLGRIWTTIVEDSICIELESNERDEKFLQ